MRWRRAAGVGIVLLVGLVCAELALRHVGYGHSMRPLVRKEFGDGVGWMYNRHCLNRFVQDVPFYRMWDYAEFVVPEEKPDDVFRVMVFGGGQAKGWPWPQYGFWRIVEVMLREQYPEMRFEFVNAAFDFSNSHVIREVATAGLEHLDPDLLLIYAGGNEFIGAYGSTNPYTLGGFVLPMPVIRASLWLGEFRTYQWVSRPFRWMMENHPIRIGDPGAPSRVARTYHHLKANLDVVCHEASERGVTVVLCTEGANLRSWPPDRTLDLKTLAAEDRHRFEVLYDEARALEKEGTLRDAIKRYEEAEALSATDARVVYRLGRCWWKLGELGEAKACFDVALERSACGFSRAKPEALDIVRRTAERWADHGVRLADAQERLAEESPGGVPGLEFFADQVHPTFEGAYVIACAAFDAIAEELASRGVDGDETHLEIERCRMLLGANATVFAEPLRTSLQFLQTRGDPDFGDFDVLEKRVEEVQKEAARLAPETIEKGLRRALRQAGKDFYLHIELVSSRILTGDAEGAVEEATRVAEAHPWRRLAQRLKGDCEVTAGEVDAAAESYEHVLELFPDDVLAMLSLGEIRERNGAFEDALALYRRAVRENPRNAQAWWHEGQVLAELDDAEHALTSIRRGMRLAPTDIVPYSRLDALLKHSTPFTREQEWRALVQSLSDYPLPRHFLARAIADQGRAEEALHLYEESAALFPGDADLVKGWADLLIRCDKLDDAIDLYEGLIRRAPEKPNLWMELADVLIENGRTERAADTYLELLEEHPAFLSAYDALDALFRDTMSPEERAKRWRAIAKSRPDAARGWVRLGYALVDLGDFDGAARGLQKAAEIDPDDDSLAACLVEVASRMAERDRESAPEASKPASASSAELPGGVLPPVAAQAMTQADGGDLDGAINYVLVAIKALPESPEAYLVLDDLLVRRDDDAGRVATWRKVARAYPESAMAHYCLGMALEAAGQADAAMEAYEMAQNLAPEDERIQTRLRDLALLAAEQLGDQGEGERAIAIYETVERLDPNNANAVLAKGVLLQTLGKTDLAADAFRRAIALDPDRTEAYSSLEAILAATKTPEERLAQWRAITEAHSDAAAAQYQLGRALEDAGDMGAAIEAYRRAGDLDAEFAPAKDRLAGVFLEEADQALDSGDAGLALQKFDSVIDIYPKHAQAICGAGMALAAMGDFDGALDRFRQVIAIDATLPEPYQRIDQFYVDHGDTEGRLAEWKQLCAEYPNAARAHLYRGMAFDAVGAKEEAVAAFRESASLDPGDAAKHTALGYALLGQENFHDAAVAFRNVLGINPDAADARIQLILALCEDKAYDEAWQEVEACRQRGIEVPKALLDKLVRDSGRAANRS